MHAQGGLPIPASKYIDQPYALGEAWTTAWSKDEISEVLAARWLEEKILELGPGTWLPHRRAGGAGGA